MYKLKHEGFGGEIIQKILDFFPTALLPCFCSQPTLCQVVVVPFLSEGQIYGLAPPSTSLCYSRKDEGGGGERKRKDSGKFAYVEEGGRRGEGRGGERVVKICTEIEVFDSKLHLAKGVGWGVPLVGEVGGGGGDLKKVSELCIVDVDVVVVVV